LNGGVNRPPDVKVVQELLNKVPVPSGGPAVKLVVDGYCGSATSNAIRNFQLRHFGAGLADGRVDPGRPTILKLNQYDTPGPQTGPGAPKLGAQDVVGEITMVTGRTEIIDYRTDDLKKYPPTVGMALHPYMIVSNLAEQTSVSIRLTSGHYFHLSGKAYLSIGPSSSSF
jgi:peptidoglycan hydrolase-like protein with peptidoglycan-binding domain